MLCAGGALALGAGCRDAHAERGAASRLAVDGDRAAEQLDEPLDDVEAEPDAAEPPGGGAVGLAEHLEDDRHVGRGDADAGVAHLEREPAARPRGRHVDAPRGRELEGVADQVLQDRLQLDAVARDGPDAEIVAPAEDDAVGHHGLELAAELVEEAVDVDETERDALPPALEPSEVERGVDEVEQLEGAPPDAPERVELAAGERAEGPFGEEVRVARDDVQRRAQL